MAVHAIARIGATLLPLNTRLSASELAWQLSDAGARIVLVDEANARHIGHFAAELPKLSSISLKH